MSKNIFILFFLSLLIPSSIYAQFGGFTVGYKMGNVKLETYSYQYSLISDENSNVIFSNQNENKFSTRSLSFGGDVVYPKFYLNFSTDIPIWKYSGSNDIGIKGKWDAKVNTFNILFAYGFDIEEKISILFGLQYEYIKYESPDITGDSLDGLTAVKNIDVYQTGGNPEYLMFDYFGANKLGGNITLLYQPSEYLCFRNTFQLNKATYKGIPNNQNWYGLGYTGFNFSNELAVYAKTKYVGLKLAYRFEVLKLSTEKIDEDAPLFYKYIPSNKATFNNFSISFMFSLGK